MSGAGADYRTVSEKMVLSPKAKTIAVIGAGSSGLAAIKSCKEEGLGVVCFERSEGIGGLWRYHDDTLEGLSSVMKTTVINTQKDMSAYSDFPPPKEYPNYMHNSLMLGYFQSYADKFGLGKHIRFNQEVIEVTQCPNYLDNGRWLIKARDCSNGYYTEEVYDGVMICIGHHVYPSVPSFPRQERFEGKMIHSHALKDAEGFKDLNVLVVGIGNSAMDAAVEISNVSKQVYLSTRRGAWVIPRSGPNGLPYDALFNCRLINSLINLVGWRVSSWLIESLFLSWRFDHALYGIKPKHCFMSQHPTINDYLPGKIISGRVIVKRNVAEFDQNSVLFEGEDTHTPIDAVVFATGYSIRFPFLDESILKKSGNQVDLYKFTFPPDLKHPSLAVMGLIQPHGAIFPIAESQSRWYALLQTGKVKLPSERSMKKHVKQKNKQLKSRYVDSQRHTIQVEYVQFMNDVAVEYGAKPNMWKFLFTDPLLFWVCIAGPCFPYHYRLQGPHAWPGARKAILEFPERFSKPLSGGVNPRIYRYSESIRAFWMLPFIFFIVLSLVAYLATMLYRFL